MLSVLAGGASVVSAATADKPGLYFSSAAGETETFLSQATVSGVVNVSVKTAGVAAVRYYLDDAAGIGQPYSAAETEPFAMAAEGGLDTARLEDGVHSVLAETTLINGAVSDFFARFLVDNSTATAAPATTAAPQQQPRTQAPATQRPATTNTSAGSADPSECKTTAADTLGWGEPQYQSHFNGTELDSTWHPYGPEPGHAKNGTRTPEAITVANGNVTITGDAQGNTGAMKWFPGQRYGRWEGCLQVSEENGYNALFLLWPDAENFPTGGEIDWVEIFDDRSQVNWFLHYGSNNDQTSGKVSADTTQWNAFALEWTPDSMTAYVNGKVWHTESDTSTFPPAPMNMCIQLDNFNRGGTASMSVDWTKQWALPESEPSTLGLAAGDPATGQPGDYPDRKPRAMTVGQMLGQ